MDVITELDQGQHYPLDVSMDAFTDMVKILDALGNEDALAIFLYARESIISSKNAIQCLGLTQKRFYSRLKDLLDNKLIEKVEGEYRHTALGSIILQMNLHMEKLLLNREKLEVLNSINKFDNISDEKKSEITKALSIQLPFLNSESRCKVVTTFDEVIKKTIEFLDKAVKKVYFASKYFDIRIVEKILDLLESGIEMHFVTPKEQSFKEISKMILSLMFDQRMVKSFYKLMNSTDINYKTIDKLPYTFIVVDQKYSMFEITKPFTREFSMAFFFEDENFSKKIKENFDAIWENAQQTELDRF